MSEARFLVGDVFEQMAKLPDGSVDLVLTSPPFLALRSYLPADHPDKGKEIGSEATPAAFLDTLLALTVEWRRILAPHGSICIELGDTYAGSGGSGGDYNTDGWRDGQEAFVGAGMRNRGKKRAEIGIEAPERTSRGAGWPLDKSLCGIPTLYAWSLAYGRNLLRPEHTLEPWRVRNLIAWCRPNPPVGALGDKVRPATSYMTVACMSRKRWFDLDAVRTESTGQTRGYVGDKRAALQGDTLGPYTAEMAAAGAPPLDWWSIPTEPYPGSHYATWPRDLCVRPIKMMCPERVCRTCGKPSERIVEKRYIADSSGGAAQSKRDIHEPDGNTRGINGDAPRLSVAHETLGWSDCGHDNYRRGVVLDPFCGTGTTLAVATGLGRDAIGIDLDARNYELARGRVGMFLGDAL